MWESKKTDIVIVVIQKIHRSRKKKETPIGLKGNTVRLSAPGESHLNDLQDLTLIRLSGFSSWAEN